MTCALLAVRCQISARFEDFSLWGRPSWDMDASDGPTVAPAPSPSDQPSARPSPAPSLRPSPRPTGAPLPLPSPQPLPLPTPRPAPAPTPPPTSSPSPADTASVRVTLSLVVGEPDDAAAHVVAKVGLLFLSTPLPLLEQHQAKLHGS